MAEEVSVLRLYLMRWRALYWSNRFLERGRVRRALAADAAWRGEAWSCIGREPSRSALEVASKYHER